MAEQDPFIEPSRRWWDPLLSIAIGAAAYLLLSLWSYPVLHPQVWEDVAIGAGLRPPAAPFPGFYRGLIMLLCQTLPLGVVLDLLPHLGRALLSLSAIGVYLIFRDILPSALRLRAHMGVVGARLGRLLAAVGALLFLCAEPIWRAGQALSPTTLFIGVTVAAIYLFFRFVRKGRIAPLYLCLVLLGFLSAETVIGFFLALFVACGIIISVKFAQNPDVPLVNPFVDGLVRAVVFKRLANTWVFSFLFGLALNIVLFHVQGGLEATGSSGVLDVLFVYYKSAVEAVRGAMAGCGYLFSLLFAIVPFFFAVRLLPRAWDDDKFLPYGVSAMYAVVGVLTLSQLAGLRPLWFWTWLELRPMVNSDMLLAFILMFDVAAVVFTLGVFGIDANCRNYRRIAQQLFPESLQYQTSAELATSLAKTRTLRRWLFWSAVALVPFCVVPGRIQSLARSMMSLMVQYADETLLESKSCDTMFTDGSFDCLLELGAKRNGRTLHCLSMMSHNSARERLIRKQASECAEDDHLLENEAAPALRTWVSTANKRLDRTAVQLGFEIWRRQRDGKNKIALPPFSGLMALPGGVASNELARAIGVARKMGDAAYDLFKDRVNERALDPGMRVDFTIAACPDMAIRTAFSFVVFRLARLAQMRSLAAEAAGNRPLAFEEAAMADNLDLVNYGLAALRSHNWIKQQNGGVLTPREGLVIGLSRADFAFAGRFAEPILKTDPNDPRANFAVAMRHYQNEEWTRAEEHLLRCLVKRPDEPAVLNNLALVELRLGKLALAEQHARKAVARRPDIPELMETLNKVLKAAGKPMEKASVKTVVPPAAAGSAVAPHTAKPAVQKEGKKK